MKHMQYYSRCFLLGMILLIVLLTLFCAPKRESSPANGLQWAIRMAESVVIRNSPDYSEWDYVTGTVLRGFEELWLITGERKYFNFIQKSVDSSVLEDGSIEGYKLSDYNIDEINEGRMLLFLYNETGSEKYKKAAELLRSQLKNHPRTSEGGFWHKKKYPYQMWLDGLYMGAPFYAEYAKVFYEPESFDDVVLQFVLVEKHMRNPETGLLYHGWDEKKEQEWADPETGVSACFWGRAVGWYAMALVDVLDYIPVDHPGRPELISILNRLAKAIRKSQDEETGVWWQILDQPGREGNYLEASASNMFVYALAKGVRKGYIEPIFRDTANSAYWGILRQFITENPDGTVDLNQICRTAGLGFGRDGSYNYYVFEENKVTNDGKGIGPFIAASIEIYKINQP